MSGLRVYSMCGVSPPVSGWRLASRLSPVRAPRRMSCVRCFEIYIYDTARGRAWTSENWGPVRRLGLPCDMLIVVQLS